MPRLIPPDVLETVASQIDAHPDGLSIDQLTALNPEIARRTLQRYLGRLVANGRVQAIGRSTARR